MIPNEEFPLKTCYACGSVKARSEFRPRQARCKPCLNLYMKLYRRARRRKVVRQATGLFTTEILRNDSLKQVEAVVNCMIARFGGVDLFCRAWADDLRAAKPGSRARLNTYLALAHMRELLDAANPPKDVRVMTDEELKQEMHQIIADFIASYGVSAAT